ncbi:MAG: methyl-accepting chemotaxis protein [Spirochaetota bacterium]
MSKNITKAAGTINRIRLMLTGLYFVSTLVTSKANTTLQNIAYSFGIGSMLCYGLAFQFLYKKKVIANYIPFALLVLDTSILGLVMVTGMLGSIQAAVQILSSPALYIIYFYYILCSAFLASKKFVIFMGYWSALLNIILIFVAFSVGVKFSNIPQEFFAGDTQNFNVEILKIFFLLGGAYMVRSVIAMIMEGEKNTKLLQDAQLAKKTMQEVGVKMLNLARNLKENIVQIQEMLLIYNQKFSSQAASIEEMSASMEELSASSTNAQVAVRKQFTQMEDMAHASTEMDSTFAQLQDTTQGLASAVEKAHEHNTTVSQLNEKTTEVFANILSSFQRVSEISSIMREIAERTNLLSLNASIEAARAGEYGRGFAVVATEVNKLASSSTKNAADISQTIQESAEILEKARTIIGESVEHFQMQATDFKQIMESEQRLKQKMLEQNHTNKSLNETIHMVNSLGKELESIAEEQKLGTEDMAQGMSSIEGAVSELVEQSQTLEDVIQSIEVTVSDLEQIGKKNFSQ